MIENITDLEKSLKLKEGTLKEAIENKESVKIELPSLVVRTAEEDEQYLTNLKNEYKTEYHTAGREIAIKEARKELGLEFEGKTMNNLLEAYKNNILKEAKVEPSKKIEELTNDANALRANLTEMQKKFEQKEAEFKAEGSKREINTRLSANIKGELTLPTEDVLTLFNSKFSTELNDEGKVIIKKNGEVLKNKTTMNPLGIEDVMPDFLAPFAKKASGGAGGEDEGGQVKKGSLEAFYKEMEKAGTAIGSEAFQKEMANRIKNKTLSL